MSACYELIRHFCSILSRNERLKGLTFIAEFPELKHERPLRNPTVCIGIDDFKIECAEGQSKLSKGNAPCTVCMSLCLCVSKQVNGSAAYGVFDEIIRSCDELIEQFNIIGITSEGVKYSNSLDCLVIPFVIVLDNGQAF